MAKLNNQERSIKISMAIGLISAAAVIIAAIITGVSSYFTSKPPVKPLAPEKPAFKVTKSFVNPNDNIIIIAANSAAKRKDPLDIKWDGYDLLKAGKPVKDPKIYKWVFSPKKEGILKEEIKTGAHSLQVSFTGVEYSKVMKIKLSDEVPIVEARIDDIEGETRGKIIEGITASKLQDPEEIIEVDVFFKFSDQLFNVDLPVERLMDDNGRIYFRFNMPIYGLPTITPDDPMYSEPFFAFRVTDEAGNDYHQEMTYGQFVAPGPYKFGANRLADIKIAKISDTDRDLIKLNITVDPSKEKPNLLFDGKPAITLKAVARGSDSADLKWESEIQKSRGEKIVSFVIKDKKNIAVVIGDKYVDKRALGSAEKFNEYQIKQKDIDGQIYGSNIEGVSVKPTPSPTPKPTVSPATPTATPTPTIKPTVPPPTPTPDSTVVVAEIWREPVTGMEFVWVPGGEFMMGSSKDEEGRYSDESPLHKVKLEGFWLARFEVTQGQWKKVKGNNPSKFKNGDNYPVEQVLWNDAKEFITKLNSLNKNKFKFALPSEAQWEYAVRAGTKTIYYTGNTENDLAKAGWYRKNSGSQTHPVGKKVPNDFGLYDMHGNVREWVEDDWHGNYEGAPVDGVAWVDKNRGSYRVIRGGSWYYDARDCRSAIRGRDSPVFRDDYVGFRLSRSATLGP